MFNSRAIQVDTAFLTVDYRCNFASNFKETVLVRNNAADTS